MQAVMELQRRLPNARVLYVSATGATEVSNLGYMQRLGLWGPGTSFRSKDEFLSLVQEQGISRLRFPYFMSCYKMCVQSMVQDRLAHVETEEQARPSLQA